MRRARARRPALLPLLLVVGALSAYAASGALERAGGRSAAVQLRALVEVAGATWSATRAPAGKGYPEATKEPPADRRDAAGGTVEREAGDLPTGARAAGDAPRRGDADAADTGAPGPAAADPDGRTAPEGPGAVHADPALGPDDVPDELAALEPLGGQGPATRPGDLAGLLDAVGTGGPDDRSRAADDFVAAAASADMNAVMAAAIPGLYAFDPEIRYYSLVGLGAAALAAPANAELLAGATPHLAARLADDDPAVREAAAATLAAVQPAPPGWTAGPLATTLSDTEPRVVAAAQAALERVGPVDARAQELVSAGLFDADPDLRSRAVRTLAAVGGGTEAGLSLLIWSLGDADSGVRWQAATSLGALGPAAIEAAPQLVLMAENPDEDTAVREAAGNALVSIAE